MIIKVRCVRAAGSVTVQEENKASVVIFPQWVGRVLGRYLV